jgi:hypothetical protein
VIVATRSLLACRATPEPTPALHRCDSYQLRSRRVLSIAGYHGKHAIRRRSFRRCWWPNLDKHSAVFCLVQDEPALRAGAASGILDKTCARRSAGGRSAPRNGPLDPTQGMRSGSWVLTGDIRNHDNTPSLGQHGVSSGHRLTRPT